MKRGREAGACELKAQLIKAGSARHVGLDPADGLNLNRKILKMQPEFLLAAREARLNQVLL